MSGMCMEHLRALDPLRLAKIQLHHASSSYERRWPAAQVQNPCED